MEVLTGRDGELNERLVDLVDGPRPQLRAVTTTLLIKALDTGGDEAALIESMVASDGAAYIIDSAAAERSSAFLRRSLAMHLGELAAQNEESNVVRVMRDHLIAQIERWASRAVDDADNRRRAERFLAWADRPGQLEAAQRRGLFMGMDASDFQRLADTRLKTPVTPETALDVWSQVEAWKREMDAGVGDAVLEQWRSLHGRRSRE
jgi:hypothetical protein